MKSKLFFGLAAAAVVAMVGSVPARAQRPGPVPDPGSIGTTTPGLSIRPATPAGTPVDDSRISKIGLFGWGEACVGFTAADYAADKWLEAVPCNDKSTDWRVLEKNRIESGKYRGLRVVSIREDKRNYCITFNNNDGDDYSLKLKECRNTEAQRYILQRVSTSYGGFFNVIYNQNKKYCMAATNVNERIRLRECDESQNQLVTNWNKKLDGEMRRRNR